MSYEPLNPNGQTTSAASSPVVIASDQTAVPVSGSVTANIGTSGSLALDATLTGGTQKTKLIDAAGTNVATVSAAGAIKVDGSAATQPVSGTVAANATQTGTWTVQPGNTANTTPWLITDPATKATAAAVPTSANYKGLLAQTANPTAATAGNLVGALADKLGKQVVVGSIRDLKVQQNTTITSSTSETTVLTAVAATFLDVYGVIVANTSATACNVTFKDATAGTARFSIYVPAGDTRGFMLPESGAHNQAAINNNWTATCGTSVASINITILAVKNT